MNKDIITYLEGIVERLYEDYHIVIPSKEIDKILKSYHITIKHQKEVDMVYDNCILEKEGKLYIFFLKENMNKVDEVFKIANLLGHIILDIPQNRDYEKELMAVNFAIIYLIPKKALTPIVNIKELAEKYQVSASMVVARIKLIEGNNYGINV